MTIHVRLAETADAALIAELSRTAFRQAFAKYNSEADMDLFMNEQFTKEMLMKEVEERDGIFLLAHVLDEAVGYARIRVENKFKQDAAIEIARLYVLDHVIGKGVGKALMNNCLKLANQMKMKMVWLGVWEKNERAISFYQNYGFEKFGEHLFLLGNDWQTDYLMRKELPGNI